MKQKFKSSKSEMDVKGSNEREPRVEDLVDVYKFPPKQWVQVRFVGPLVSYGRHWVETKKADGSKTSFPKTCLSYDPETEEHDSTKPCPWCDVSDDRVRFGPAYYQNAIIREIEEDGPSKKAAKQSKTEAKTGFKDRGSRAWTPVRVISLTGAMVRQIKKLGGLNRHTDKKTGEKKAFSVSHVKYGCDISIEFDPEAKEASKKYTFQKGDATKLSEEQQDYLLYQIEGLMTPDKKDVAKAEVKRWLEKMGKKKSKDEDDSDDDDDSDSDDSGDDDDDDEDEPKGKSKKNKGKDKGKKNKGKSKKSDDDDDDLDEDDDDLPDEDDSDDDDDDDEPKKKGKKGKDKKKNKKSKDEDDDDDLDDDSDGDDDDDDEDDEDEPKGKSKKNKKSKDEDDDDDLDDDDELDDDDDEPKGKSKKNKGKKPKKSDEDDDDSDDEDDSDSDDSDGDDDDDEDEPKKKVKDKKSKKGKDKKKGKKSKDEDDDDLDDDDDDDD